MRPFLLGLTGSIGTGKSTACAMFADRGIPVWDADAAVHRLYSRNGAAVDPVAELCPRALVSGQIDREVLRDWIADDQDNLARLEAVVHPPVAADRADFINATNAPIMLFDIPLLFETGADKWLDAVAVVSVDEDIQRQRVMSRPGMAENRFQLILSKQMPDVEKRQKADYLIPSDTLESAEKAVEGILTAIKDQLDA